MFKKENREGEPFVADVTKAIKNGSLTALEGTILADIEAQIHQGKKVGIREMAARNFTSTTTIIRLAKKLGYQGFTDMYYALMKEAENGHQEQWEAVPFLERFTENMRESENDYAQLTSLAETLCQCKGIVYICGMGFSSFPADYFCKKLLVQGVTCIFSGAEESSGIFENNLASINLFIAVSKSGETPKIVERVRRAQAGNIRIAAFTGNVKSTLAKASDILIKMEDEDLNDDRNLKPCFFFAGILLKMEQVILEMQRIKKNEKAKKSKK